MVYFPISVPTVTAAPPDPCFGNGAPGCEAACQNNPEKLQATCCWLAPDGKHTCQTCEVNTQTGEFENCYYEKTGELDDTVISQPPSDVASPPSTEKCPDNVAIDNNGNCSPVIQSPEESTNNENNDNNKPQIPRGEILNELQQNQNIQTLP
ncbi:MAG TPA: hypothetical protein VFT71_02860 [Candidatus Nitrosocosmicus sp.]|nr:hypothetical protein [Candidatus Nitrosocosmicus sp.]